MYDSYSSDVSGGKDISFDCQDCISTLRPLNALAISSVARSAADEIV